MQKHVNLVDLVKSFPTSIFLQNLASIQKRTSPIKFDHLAEKSEYGSISNLSTKRSTRLSRGVPSRPGPRIGGPFGDRSGSEFRSEVDEFQKLIKLRSEFRSELDEFGTNCIKMCGVPRNVACRRIARCP